ncbi:MAG TPA: hypothetical protein VFN57_03370 [Thermomicrobiaceae bacterium]|nr:hypothetical protein [Thermomicrobiaceae bacterium]
MTTIRRAVITAGVADHHALTRPGDLLGDFNRLDLGGLASTDFTREDLPVVLDSTDNGSLQARRDRVAGVPAGVDGDPRVAAAAPGPPGRA